MLCVTRVLGVCHVNLLCVSAEHLCTPSRRIYPDAIPGHKECTLELQQTSPHRVTSTPDPFSSLASDGHAVTVALAATGMNVLTDETEHASCLLAIFHTFFWKVCFHFFFPTGLSAFLSATFFTVLIILFFFF